MDAQETPQPDSLLVASYKMVVQILPLVSFGLASVMLLNVLIVQPLKESQAAAQAQLAQTQTQLAQTLAQTQAQLAQTLAQTQAQVKEAQAESRVQFTDLKAALQEVPRLSGKVEVMQDGLRSLQQQRR